MSTPRSRCSSTVGPWPGANPCCVTCTSHANFRSDSAHGGISIVDGPKEFRFANFISMHPPRHDEQRKAVSPIVSPGNLAAMEGTIRARTCKVLDDLPRDQTFNWVDRVSIELTTQMLATLFAFPFEDRKLLTWWSDVATTIPGTGGITSIATWDERQAELLKCLACFTRLWNERVNAPPNCDLVSMLAHAPATRDMGPREFLGNLILLIVGGNDTTRNSMTGGLLALHQNPVELTRLRADPALIASTTPDAPFGRGDFWVLRYRGNEIDDGSVAIGPPYEADIDRWVNGEPVSDHDVAVWYGAHFTHDVNHDGPARPDHIVGPDLVPVNR